MDPSMAPRLPGLGRPQPRPGRATTSRREHAALGPEHKPAPGNRSRPLRSRLRGWGVSGENGAHGLKRPSCPCPPRGASAPDGTLELRKVEDASQSRASPRLATSSPPPRRVWFLPGRAGGTRRRGRRTLPRPLRARFADVSRALSLKGPDAPPGEPAHLGKSGGLRLRGGGSASGLCCCGNRTAPTSRPVAAALRLLLGPPRRSPAR